MSLPLNTQHCEKERGRGNDEKKKIIKIEDEKTHETDAHAVIKKRREEEDA